LVGCGGNGGGMGGCIILGDILIPFSRSPYSRITSRSHVMIEWFDEESGNNKVNPQNVVLFKAAEFKWKNLQIRLRKKEGRSYVKSCTFSQWDQFNKTNSNIKLQTCEKLKRLVTKLDYNFPFVFTFTYYYQL